jgi:hypothetical protein
MRIKINANLSMGAVQVDCEREKEKKEKMEKMENSSDYQKSHPTDLEAGSHENENEIRCVLLFLSLLSLALARLETGPLHHVRQRSQSRRDCWVCLGSISFSSSW